jgi:hypothetical protein
METLIFMWLGDTDGAGMPGGPQGGLTTDLSQETLPVEKPSIAFCHRWNGTESFPYRRLFARRYARSHSPRSGLHILFLSIELPCNEDALNRGTVAHSEVDPVS